jgi:hypothetical protein
LSVSVICSLILGGGLLGKIHAAIPAIERVNDLSTCKIIPV